MVDVPAMALAVSPAVPVMSTAPEPRVPIHVTDVCDAQPAVEHTSRLSAAVSVVSVGAKFMPVKETLAVTDATL